MLDKRIPAKILFEYSGFPDYGNMLFFCCVKYVYCNLPFPHMQYCGRRGGWSSQGNHILTLPALPPGGGGEGGKVVKGSQVWTGETWPDR